MMDMVGTYELISSKTTYTNSSSGKSVSLMMLNLQLKRDVEMQKKSSLNSLKLKLIKMETWINQEAEQ